MVTVSLTILWMSVDDFGNQILVAITTILTVIAFAFSIESNLPKVPYVTYIDAFFLCCYFFVFLTVVELMAVNMVLRSRGHHAAIGIRHVAQWTVPTVFIILNVVLIPHFLVRAAVMELGLATRFCHLVTVSVAVYRCRLIAAGPAGDVWIMNNWQDIESCSALPREELSTHYGSQGVTFFFGMTKP
ncbi:MAG: hypothetical protein C5B58_06665, partial [Acidobacteria bacterium]